MKLRLFFLFFLLIANSHAAQTTPAPQTNLDFESVVDDLPVGWNIFSDTSGYVHGVDTTHVQSGITSFFIDSNGQRSGFASVSYSIPSRYQGSKITLRGYIKTENVSNGWAGLLLRLDPNAGFDNMQKNGVIGTTDWQQYKIDLDLKPQQTNTIVVGGLLVGSGKVWLDNLELSIDGMPFTDAPLIELSNAQKDLEFDHGSNIAITDLDDFKTNTLVLLGKIWGLLKYHHPAVTRGNYNWDYELFRILPRLLATIKNQQRDQLFLEWIDSLGQVVPCTSCKLTAKDAMLKPDLNWISQSEFSKELQTTLLQIYTNRSQNKQYYVEATNVGNPNFINENNYSNMVYPDDGFRLLALYRYWNMIHYFFPYKYLIDTDWHAILKQYIPTFIAAKNRLDYELAALQLIGEVHDSHANLWGGNSAIEAARGDYYPPVLTRMIEDKLVVYDFYTESPADNDAMSQKVGMKIGDIIVAINGEPVEQIIQQQLAFYPASNRVIKLRNIALDILRSTEGSVAIEYIRNGQKHTLKLALFKKSELAFYRGYRRELDKPSFKILDNNIGYITLKNIQASDINNIKSQLKNTKGIVIDIRNYPATFVVYTLGSFFLHDSTPFTKITKPNFNNPGEFTFLPPLEIRASNSPYQGKLVVLVNEFSVSQSEFTAMAFKAAKKTTIIGSITAGADGNVSRIELPGRLSTAISGLGIYYPDGRETQRVGIIPDIVISPTIEGIKSGRDEMLERAIEEINKE